MTTKVTVDAHAGWPVKVARVFHAAPPGHPERSQEMPIVAPNTAVDFHIWDGMSLLVTEMPHPIGPVPHATEG